MSVGLETLGSKGVVIIKPPSERLATIHGGYHGVTGVTALAALPIRDLVVVNVGGPRVLTHGVRHYPRFRDKPVVYAGTPHHCGAPTPRGWRTCHPPG